MPPKKKKARQPKHARYARFGVSVGDLIFLDEDGNSIEAVRRRKERERKASQRRK